MPTDSQRRQQASAHHAEVQDLNARIAVLTAENNRLEGLVYTPGLWRCAKCNFVLVQRNLNANSGTITARDQPGDKCPNCDVNLWRITERENARDNYETAERLHIELNEAKGCIALLEHQLADAQKDTARLDFMIFYSAEVRHGRDGEYCRVVWQDDESDEQTTKPFGDSRQAIDAAIAKEQT